MTSAPDTLPTADIRRGATARDGAIVAALVIGGALTLIALILVAPLAVVLWEAFRHGMGAYLRALSDPDAVAAMRLTGLIALIAVPVNTAFGVALAWAVTKFRFPGRDALTTLIDVPLSVSPVIAGMVFVLLFGLNGVFGPWLAEVGLKIVFSPPGLVLATLFVTVPFVARELIPLMREQGTDEEEAAAILGASGWTIFRRITLPNIKWGLIQGVLLSNARAMGEFGAVSVVSGHIRGETNTLPLHIEALYNEYDFAAAFAVASLLSFLGIATMIVKALVDWRLGAAHRPTGH